MRVFLAALVLLPVLASGQDRCFVRYTFGCPGCGRSAGQRAEALGGTVCYACTGFCYAWREDAQGEPTFKTAGIFKAKFPIVRAKTSDILAISQINPMAAEVIHFLSSGEINGNILQGKMMSPGVPTTETLLYFMRGVVDDAAELATLGPMKNPSQSYVQVSWHAERRSPQDIQVIFDTQELSKETEVVVNRPYPKISVHFTGTQEATLESWTVVQSD